MSVKLIIIFGLLHIHVCRAGVIISPEITTPLPTPIPDPESLRGGCEYDGDYYEPGIIQKSLQGSCELLVTCEEGGGVLISDSDGCIQDTVNDISTPDPEVKGESLVSPTTVQM
ncbi:uncharacterized protein LOC125665547 [Ostrea edulis]|uniref:uncharacterized protein LOC125665547 n=1 Tax=Ostrea edulis TaxID=37623 RepID=UPI0024AF033D|nr:uncharacterized protein LOC125665547 [Ostrea edulis]